MSDIMIPRDKILKPHSTALRNNATKQENRLWYDHLRKCAVHFYRQRIIGEYIVDFYCPKAKLIIELDGSQHYEPEAIVYDEIRSDYFRCFGLHVLRFSNIDIDNNLHGVCQMIDTEVSKRIK